MTQQELLMIRGLELKLDRVLDMMNAQQKTKET